MKALSIKQPWAQLIACGIKDVENRSWKTSYRGKILIHASAKRDDRYSSEMSTLMSYSQFNAIPEKMQRLIMFGTNQIPVSAIIGECNLVNITQNSNSVWAEEGQYHWLLNHIVLYDHPIYNVKGKLRLWEYGSDE